MPAPEIPDISAAETAARLLVICGPTATGKTDLAIALARRLGGEIVNADSRQVYRYMDIGTAKPSPAQRAAAPHHLLDMVDPDQPFTLADYLDRARTAVAAIAARGKLPIVVGGTGLYVRSLVQGYAVPRVAPNAALRTELEAIIAQDGLEALVERLRRTDPQAARRIDARNPRRVIRAVEVAESGGAVEALPQPGGPAYDALALGLTAPRALLHERADRRVEAMLAAGLVAEVEALRARGYTPDLPSMSSLGYREMWDYLCGEVTLAEAVASTTYATHRFIRRQLTWFRREPGLHWLDLAAPDLVAEAQRRAEAWLAARTAPAIGGSV